MKTLTMNLSELKNHVTSLVVTGDFPLYGSTAEYLMDLLPSFDVKYGEDEDGKATITITEDVLTKINETIEAYNRIQYIENFEDGITDEQIDKICGLYDPTDLSEQIAAIDALEAQIEENSKPHGEIMEDGWHELEDGRKLYVKDGRAMHTLRYEGTEAIEQHPYRWSKKEQVMVLYRPWATTDDMAAVEWRS